MNGLNNYERGVIEEIRELAKVDLSAAKEMASKFKASNKKRRARREMALRCIKYLHSHFAESK